MSIGLDDPVANRDQDISPTTQSKSRSSPLGSTIRDGGVNFSIFSRSATGMELLLFDHEDDARPERIIPIDPSHRTYHYWHAFVSRPTNRARFTMLSGVRPVRSRERDAI